MRTHDMSEYQEQEISIDELNAYIDKLKAQAELPEALERLQKNKDFQLIIEQEYLREEAVRLTENKCHPEFQTPERQALLDRGLFGVSHMTQFFNRIRVMGEMAKRDLAQAESDREEFYSSEVGQE